MTVCVTVKIAIAEAVEPYLVSLTDLGRAKTVAERGWAREGSRYGLLGTLVDVRAVDDGRWRGLLVRVNVPDVDDGVVAALMERAEDVANGEHSGFAFDEITIGEVRQLP